MFNIVICDDQREILNNTEKFIRSLLADGEYMIECYESAAELLAEDLSETDLFVLDIGMPNVDGFELAQRLNEKYLNTKIIFLTSEADRVFDGYKYRAFRFVVKGDEDGLKEGVLSVFNAKSGAGKITLSVKNSINERSRLTINKEHIIYFEYNMRRLSVTTLNGRFEVRGEKLADLTERLSEKGFMCVHRSYLVNMAHISCFDKNDMVLSNGEKIYIGSKASMVREIKQQYFRYIEHLD